MEILTLIVDRFLVAVESHLQTIKHTPSTTIKRQKIRPPKSSKSYSSLFVADRKSHDGCVTAKDFDEFWAPPEPGYLARGCQFKVAITPEASDEENEECQEDNEMPAEEQRFRLGLSRRRSESILSPPRSPFNRTPNYIPSKNKPRLYRPLNYPTITSVPKSKPISFESNNKDNIEDRLKDLLLSPAYETEYQRPSNYSIGLRQTREAEKAEEGRRRAKQRRLVRCKPSRPLVQYLDKNWENAVNNAHREPSEDKVITKAIKGTELRRDDFRKLLEPRSWLNDEVINAYLEWIEDAANNAAAAADDPKHSGEAKPAPKFIAHNTFFYNTLLKKGPAQTLRLMGRKGAPGTKFLDVDSMFVPICKASHWTIGVVRPVAKTIEYFDSMGGSPRQFENLMRNWLEVQLGKAYIADEWKMVGTECARQTNGYDCGVFLCSNALCVALGLDTFCYAESDMTLQRRNIAAVLLNRGFHGDWAWSDRL